MGVLGQPPRGDRAGDGKNPAASGPQRGLQQGQGMEAGRCFPASLRDRAKGLPFPPPLLPSCLCPASQLPGVLWAATDRVPEAFGSACPSAHSFLETLVHTLSFHCTSDKNVFPLFAVKEQPLPQSPALR